MQPEIIFYSPFSVLSEIDIRDKIFIGARDKWQKENKFNYEIYLDFLTLCATQDAGIRESFPFLLFSAIGVETSYSNES